MDFSGKSIELRGFMRTENVTEFAGLWMREDGDVPTLQFDNMQSRQIKGTTDWTEYSIVLPIHLAVSQTVEKIRQTPKRLRNLSRRGK